MDKKLIKSVTDHMKKDSISEYRGLTSAGSPDSLTSLRSLSKRVGDLELEIAEIKAMLNRLVHKT